MKKNLVTVAIILMFTLTLFSGCTRQQGTTTDNNNKLSFGTIDTFSVDSTGGRFSVLQDTIEVNMDEGSVSSQVDITVEFVQNPVDDSSLYVASCYEFGPNGLTFEKLIEVIIYYDNADLPAGLLESDLKMYVYNESFWEPIEGSYANQNMHSVVAQVSHFSKMACCGPAPNNTSAQYWFKADLNFYSYKDLRLTDSDHDDHYVVGVSAYWDPVPYVQYYQFKFEFHGNPPQDYAWSCDHRDQGKDGCLPSHTSLYEGYIYQLGGDPHNEGFMGSYDGPNVATIGKKNKTTGEIEVIVYGQLYPNEKHGFGFKAFEDTVDDYEELSDIAIGVLVSEMQTFLEEYVGGWEVWVRGVTERGA